MDIKTFCNQIQSELHDNILSFWIKNTLDDVNGGFVGEITYNNKINLKANKGAILNSRILWTFSSAFLETKEDKYLELAHRAYDYYTTFFIDGQYGGSYWMLDYLGNSVDQNKQIYGQAFSIYALATYYQATGKKEALKYAMDIFHLIEKHSFDSQKDGYIDAFTRTWEPTEKSMISPSGAESPKTMNTHLHILEAYTQLYRVWDDDSLRKQLKGLVQIHLDKIINPETGHFLLFFDRDWNPTSELFSYGHDIEGAWLMHEAAEVLNEESLSKKVRTASNAIAEVTLREGLASDNGLMYEGKPGAILDADRHWWPQAEAMVGFIDAYQATQQKKYLDTALNIWEFTKKYIVNPTGEWYWRVDEHHKINPNDDKVGPWKGPYHNSRACMEILRRLG